MSEKTFRSILKIGVFASLATIFVVISNMYFPYVSSKQLIFNILIEILLVFYFVFIIKYPKYRPKKSLVLIGLVSYFLAIVLSLFVSVDFNLSFWGDMERMLGLFGLLHFLALFFIIISVFRTKKDYYQLFNVLLVVCLLIVFFLFGSLGEKHSQSILGNRAYLAAIMLFALFLNSLMLNRVKDWWLKLLYISAFPFFIFGLIKADISGSHAGLAVGIFVSLFIFSIFSKNRKIKVIGLSALSVFVVAIVMLFAFRDHKAFDNNYIGAALRDFNSENVTLNTRLISWKAAGKYLIDHPVNLIFGVGHGNYALIFDKYFDAKFYDFDRSQTYFDRAHNNLIDIGTTTGIVGLLAYLSLMVFVFISFIKAYVKNKENDDSYKGLGVVELSILSGLLAAYFIQNLAVFDSFATYIFIMIIIAFAHFLNVANSGGEEMAKGSRKVKESTLFIVFLIIASFFIFNVNVRAIKTSNLAIEGYIAFHNKDLVKAYNMYSEMKELNSFLIRDARGTCADNVVNFFPLLLEDTSKEDLERIILLSIEFVDANVDYNPSDSMTLFKASRIYETASKFYLHYRENEKASDYNMIALNYMNLAIESSPQRVPLYSYKSNLLLSFNKKEEAISLLVEASSINTKMPDPFCQLSDLYFTDENIDSFLDVFPKCINNGGLIYLGMEDFVSKFEKYFYERNDWESLSIMYKVLIANNSSNASWLSNSALSHQNIGDYETARLHALMILDVDKSYQNAVDKFLNDLNSVNEE